jgi:hypothetical protein
MPLARIVRSNPGLVFGGRALQLIDEWPVNLLDRDAAALHGLDGIGESPKVATQTVHERIFSRSAFGLLTSRRRRSISCWTLALLSQTLENWPMLLAYLPAPIFEAY